MDVWNRFCPWMEAQDLVIVMPVDLQVMSARMRGVVVALIVVAVLSLAKAIFIPLALAILLSFVLAPMVQKVERLGIGRIGAVIVVQIACTTLLASLLVVLGSQLIELSSAIPEYRKNLVQRARDIRELMPAGLVKAQSALEEIEEEVLSEDPNAEDGGKEETDADQGNSRAANEKSGRDRQWDLFFEWMLPSSSSDQKKPPGPVSVAIVSNQTDLADRVFGFVNPVLGPIGTFGIVIVLTIFILLDREDFRNRIVQLFGSANLAVATRAINEATDRSMTWLRTMASINSIYGVAVTAGLAMFGLPNALLWGGLAFFCRFLPYLGPWLGAILPVLLSLAASDGWALPLGVATMYIVLELIVNMVLEPLMYGRSLGLTSIGIIIAAVFWTWLWGPVGLLVAVPITMWLVVLGHHIPQMSYFPLLFGDMGELPSYHRLYQRLLAFDEPESVEIMNRHLEKEGPSGMFDRVLAPLFLRLGIDRQSGFVDEEQTEFVYSTIDDHIENLPAAASATGMEDHSEPESGATNLRPDLRVLIVPTGDEPEDIMGKLLRSLLLAKFGCEVDLAGSSLLTNEILEHIDHFTPDVVVFCTSNKGSPTKVRAVCKRLPRSERRVKMLVWHAHDPDRSFGSSNRQPLDIDGSFSSADDVVQQVGKVNRRVDGVPALSGG